MRSYLVVAAAAAAAAILVGVLVYAGQSGASEPAVRTVAVGALHPLTGPLSALGADTLHATTLAAEDFNEYLEGRGADWRLDLVHEDTSTSPTVALEKVQALHTMGVEVIVGPASSANIQNAKGYADANDMMLFSCCSSSSGLTIPGDSVFRMSLDNKKHGVAMGRIMMGEVDALVPIWRADSYGESFKEDAVGDFEARGGVADAGVRYTTDAREFGIEVSVLNERVEALVAERGADRVGVMIVAFEESIPIMQAASRYEALGEVRWFGSHSMSKSVVLANDPESGGFAERVGFVSTDVALDKGHKYDMLVEYIAEKTGDTPSSNIHASYDSVWLVGLAMLEAGAHDAASVKANLHGVAAEYEGALGSARLNAAGDLDVRNLAIVGLADGAWVDVGTYDADLDEVAYGAAAPDPQGNGDR